MKASPFLRKLIRPEVLLLLLAVFFYIRQIQAGEQGRVIHFYFTYYVLSWPWWLAPLPMLLVLLAAVYWLTRSFRQWKGLQYLHVLSYVTIPILMYLLSPEFGLNYYLNHKLQPDFVYRRLPDIISLLAALILLLGQLAFLVNLVAGFIRGKKSVPALQ